MPAPNKIDAARVRELLAQGCTVRQIMARLGTNKTTVYRIQREARERHDRA